jgi:cysteine desulfuration protein SufE
MMSIQETAQELVETFELLDEGGMRYEHVIDLARSLPALSQEEKIDANKVQGCVAQVWLAANKEQDGTLNFKADSDSLIVKGLIAILLQVYSHRTPADILAFNAKDFIERLGFDQQFTMGRRNGIDGMVQKIRALAIQG